MADANLMVTPSRVVFEERTRSAQVTLLNKGDETGTFRISFIRRQMTESGRFVEAEEDETGLYSDAMVRYSPRQITLPPGQPQVVRLMLRKPRDLEEGEYRSHMLFQSIPDASKSSLESAMAAEQQGISVEIIPIVGISIPVIVRHGRLESEVRLENPRLIPVEGAMNGPQVALEMHRNGNRSVYGDFRAILTPKGDGEPLTVGRVNGVAVYTPNTLRRFSLPLNIPRDIAMEGGVLRVLYLESGKDEKSGLLAETELVLE
ncbi:MAG: molecular chaperone [Pseudomonadota bacterium]